MGYTTMVPAEEQVGIIYYINNEPMPLGLLQTSKVGFGYSSHVFRDYRTAPMRLKATWDSMGMFM